MAAQPETLPAMSKGTLILACFVLAFTNFMVVLDTTIANVSVAHIAGGLGTAREPRLQRRIALRIANFGVGALRQQPAHARR